METNEQLVGEESPIGKRKADNGHNITQVESFEPPPKLTNSERLALLGGEVEVFEYYRSVRETVTSLRAGHNGVEGVCGNGGNMVESVPCDPRDSGMCERIRQKGWQARVCVRDVSGSGAGDSQMAGSGGCGDEGWFKSRQTAFDEEDYSVEEEAGRDESKKTDHNSEKEQSFPCGVQGCSAEFSSLASYESHYHTSHHYVCHVCRRVFVSNFLLDIHLEENHDSYFHVLSPKIDMYRCLVKTCCLKFRTSDLRKEHLIAAHKYPPGFSLHKPIKDKSQVKTKTAQITNTNPEANKTSTAKPSKKKTKKRRANVNSCNTELMESENVENKAPQNEEMQPEHLEMELVQGAMDGSYLGDKETAVSSSNIVGRSRGSRGGSRGQGHSGKSPAGLGKSGGSPRSIPTSICFGRGSQRAFQHRGGRGRHWHQTHRPDTDTAVDIEKMDFADIADSLVDCT